MILLAVFTGFFAYLGSLGTANVGLIGVVVFPALITAVWGIPLVISLIEKEKIADLNWKPVFRWSIRATFIIFIGLGVLIWGQPSIGILLSFGAFSAYCAYLVVLLDFRKRPKQS